MTSSELTRLLEDDLARRFEQIPGVGAINIRGGIRREIRVELRRDRLRASGLTALDVQQALLRENVTLPAGNVKSGTNDLYVRAMGEYPSVEAVARTVIASPRGKPIRVRDVAEVRDSYEDARYLVEMNGAPAISVGIQKQSGANTVAVAEAVRARDGADQPRARRRAPRGGQRSERVHPPVHRQRSQLGAVGLAAGDPACSTSSCAADLSTAIIALSIPISVIATFGLLFFGGMTLNQMTFGGLALGVGPDRRQRHRRAREHRPQARGGWAAARRRRRGWQRARSPARSSPRP